MKPALRQLELFKVLLNQRCVFGVMATAFGNLMRRSWAQPHFY